MQRCIPSGRLQKSHRAMANTIEALASRIRRTEDRHRSNFQDQSVGREQGIAIDFEVRRVSVPGAVATGSNDVITADVIRSLPLAVQTQSKAPSSRRTPKEVSYVRTKIDRLSRASQRKRLHLAHR